VVNVKNIDAQFNSDILDAFANWLDNQGKAEGTVKTYVSVLEKFQSWLMAQHKDLTVIKNVDVQSYMDYLEDQQKNPGTIEKYLAAISVFSRFSNNIEIVLNIQKKEKVKSKEITELLEDDEVKKILSDIESDGNERNIAIMYTLMHTGIRISELCSLNRNDIEINDGKGKLAVRNKNEVDRVIPLSKEAIKHLDAYIQTSGINDGALFVSSVNRRISPRGVQYMLEKYDVNPHKLRHTFCKQLIKKGIDIHTVAMLAGHKDINVTKRYIDDVEVNLEDAIDQAF
jgi:integrase/recombinase XerD